MTKQEAIKLIDDRMCFGRGMWSEHHMPEIDDYWKAGQMAIKALEEPHWIPCSETVDLPDHEVLCCDGYGEELIGWLSYSDDQWLCESDGDMMYDPIAWCEKPEPWKGDDE